MLSNSPFTSSFFKVTPWSGVTLPSTLLNNTDLPLPQPVVNSPSVMINLIGSDVNYDWLKLPLVHLHWYDKEVRPST